MRGSEVRFIWTDPRATSGFRTGVSLHGHTMHSQECLDFLPRYLHSVPGLSQITRRYQQPAPGAGPAVDFARAFWTPPLNPAAALRLESAQITALGLQPLVSLTDHDDIEAGLALQLTRDSRYAPVSVEWTVPYAALGRRRSILHIGVHNLPACSERSWMAAMAAYTAAPDETRLPGLLYSLAALPETLIVLNHPFWLEEGVKADDHEHALARFLPQCLDSIHAFELNATRPWSENAATISLAAAHHRPVISGGDRHACEPGAAINLTSAQSFPEFVSEIRDGSSTLLFMPQYREPLGFRILEAGWDILRPYPEYPGRERWTDRIFYRDESGTPRPLSLLWKDQVPWMLNGATGLVQLLATTPLRNAMRLLLAQRGEALL
jgi:hypothetical protein